MAAVIGRDVWVHIGQNRAVVATPYSVLQPRDLYNLTPIKEAATWRKLAAFMGAFFIPLIGPIFSASQQKSLKDQIIRGEPNDFRLVQMIDLQNQYSLFTLGHFVCLTAITVSIAAQGIFAACFVAAGFLFVAYAIYSGIQDRQQLIIEILTNGRPANLVERLGY